MVLASVLTYCQLAIMAALKSKRGNEIPLDSFIISIDLFVTIHLTQHPSLIKWMYR
jgi:hypothetical protein